MFIEEEQLTFTRLAVGATWVDSGATLLLWADTPAAGINHEATLRWGDFADSALCAHVSAFLRALNGAVAQSRALRGMFETDTPFALEEVGHMRKITVRFARYEGPPFFGVMAFTEREAPREAARSLHGGLSTLNAIIQTELSWFLDKQKESEENE